MVVARKTSAKIIIKGVHLSLLLALVCPTLAPNHLGIPEQEEANERCDDKKNDHRDIC